MQTASHSQQPQAALDWHLLQQSMVVRALTMGPMLPSPPMMTFSRKADALQHVGAATDNESGWGDTSASSTASSASFMLPPSEMLERSLRTTRHAPAPPGAVAGAQQRTAAHPPRTP